MQTTPPAGGVAVALYDGRCGFCTASARRLQSRARGRLRIASFHDPGVLDAFPGLRPDDCQREMKLVLADGSVLGGAAAALGALSLGVPATRVLVRLHGLPGLRYATDAAYRLLSRHRMRLAGSCVGACPTGERGLT